MIKSALQWNLWQCYVNARIPHWCGWLQRYPSTLLHGWIWCSRIVNPLYLISYTFIIQYVLQVRCYSLELRNGHVLEVLYLFTPRCMYCRSVWFSLITLHGVSVLHRVRVLRHQETLTCLHENEAFFFSFWKKKWPTIKAYFPKWPKF